MKLVAKIWTCAAAALAMACVQPVGSEEAPQCDDTSDCDHAQGEICDEGICWGDPPDSVTFAAVISPPDERLDLTLTEIPVMPIARDGSIDVLYFGESFTVSGRVLLVCDDPDPQPGCSLDQSIAARVTFERPSRIPGAPAFKRTLDALAGSGPDDEPAFTAVLPALLEGERYDVTITPDAVLGEEVVLNPAEVAPPTRITLAASSETKGLEINVGSPNALKRIVGRVRSEFSMEGTGIKDMQVFARGRWDSASPMVRASNVVTTGPDGLYSLAVPIAMEDEFEIVARPIGETVAPSLVRAEVYMADPPSPVADADPLELSDIITPPVPNASPFVVTIAGTDPSGEEVQVVGAEVTLTTILPPAAGDAETVATYSASGSTMADGTVELLLYPGAEDDTRLYDMRVVPPSESLSATLYSKEVQVAGVPGAGRGFLQQVVLGSRVPFSGTLMSANEEPIGDASVTLAASRLFRLSLAPAAQSVLDALAYPSSVTGGDGGFVVWADPSVATESAIYDLELVPPAESLAPRWSADGVHVQGDENGTVSLGDVILPPASNARGLINVNGEPVANAELRIYQIDDNSILCEQLSFGDSTPCAPTARLRGIWRSRDDGWVHIVVPDADAL